MLEYDNGQGYSDKFHDLVTITQTLDAAIEAAIYRDKQEMGMSDLTRECNHFSFQPNVTPQWKQLTKTPHWYFKPYANQVTTMWRRVAWESYALGATFTISEWEI